MPNISPSSQVTISATYGMIDNSNKTGELNGKKCSMMQSNDTTVTNLANGNRVGSFLKNINKKLENIASYCQPKLLTNLSRFFSRSPINERDSLFQVGVNHIEVGEMQNESTKLVRKLYYLITSDYKNYENKEALHAEIFAQLEGIRNAISLETKNVRSYAQDVCQDSHLELATKELTFDEKLNFLRYFKNEKEGTRFLNDNFQKREFETLQTIINKMEEQVIYGNGD